MWKLKSVITKLIVVAATICIAPFAVAHGTDAPQHNITELGKFEFEGGGTIPNLRMSYVTHGKLSASKDNAILVLHGFGANHHSFDGMIGPGKPLDTDKYFIISPDQLGNTQVGFDHSTSPSNSGMKMNFPAYNHRDMVKAQHKLVSDGLDIRHLVAVAGISMGAAHSVQYAVSYPNFMDAIVPIVGGAVFGSESRLWNTQVQSVIENCGAWQKGNYVQNSTDCAGAAMWTLVNYFFSREWWDANMATQEAFDEFRKGWWGFYVGIQDMRDLYYLSKAFGKSSVAATPGFNGDLAAALKSIKAKTLFVYSPRDMFFLPKYIDEQTKHIANAKSVAIDSTTGHLICCGVDPQAYWIMGETIRGFLSELKLQKTAAAQ